ncbi:hypothetical protein OAO87_04370 [bacterium]|nr:hypothetical protein [bacterium]
MRPSNRRTLTQQLWRTPSKQPTQRTTCTKPASATAPSRQPQTRTIVLSSVLSLHTSCTATVSSASFSVWWTSASPCVACGNGLC